MGHRIHYYEKGAGPTLVLVHGFSGSAAREWGRVIDLLARQHRVIALHQVGFAPSDQPEIVYDTKAFVDHLGGFIRALNLPSVVLVGESFGGWVAASYAVATVNRSSALPSIEKLVISAGAIGMVKQPSETARNVFDAQVQIEMREALKRYPRLDNQRTIKLAMEQSGLMKREPNDSALSGIDIPTLLIWGDKDEVVPLQIGKQLARTIRGSRMIIFPGVGHIVAVESPAEFARVVREFAQN
jgi:2-hydroxy-6-oxo-octa-2,4-dienoate hydrolase